MAKRRHTTEQELPFVALMDTMTNVVGVLTIVLVMIGLSLASAVNRVLSALPPATPEQVQAAQAALDAMKASLTPDQEKLKTMAKPDLTPTQLKAIETEIARLELTAKEKGVKLLNLDALTKEQEKRDAELKQKKADIEKLMAEQEKLKALLDSTPPPKAAPPAKIVRIPAGQPIPADAVKEIMLVTKDGIHWIDIDGAKEAFLREFKSSPIRATVHDRVKRGDQNVVIYDHEKLDRYFDTRKLMFHEFRLDVVFDNWSSSPLLKLTPTALPSANLLITLRRFKSQPKTVVIFRVTGDGFENYLAAREACDMIGVPAGWEFSGTADYSFRVADIQSNKPVPPPPAPKPPGTGPDEIKRPTQRLD